MSEELKRELGTDHEDFHLHLLEAVGSLVVCIHWLRGTFNWMIHTGAVKFPTPQDKVNYERLFKAIEDYETHVWEIVPSRAMLPILRQLRQDGTLTEDWEKLLEKDQHGRIPYNGAQSLEAVEQILRSLPESGEDIADILRRVGDARIARLKNVRNP